MDGLTARRSDRALPSALPASFPLTGRARELDRVLALLGDPLPESSPVTGVVVVGAAGVGKTRLVREACDRLRARGYTPIDVAASAVLADVPFGAFREVLPPFDDQVGSWLRVLREGADRVAAAAGTGFPLLVVDDLHELDPGSVALVLHVLDAGVAHLLGTMRGEIELRPHVRDLLKRFWGDRLAERIDLGPLGHEGVAEVAEAVLGAPLDAVSVERLWSWTGGNALLLWHTLAEGSVAPRFDERAGVWHLDRAAIGGPARAGGEPIAPEVAGAVERALGSAREEVRDVVRLLAESDVLSLDVLVEAAGADAVDAAEDAGVIVAGAGPRGETYRLQHPLYGDVLLAGETPADRRARRHQLATALLARAGSVDAVPAADRVLLALWYVDQDDLGPDAAQVLLDAAAQSMRSWHHRAAIRFVEPVWHRTASLDAGLLLCRAYDALGLDDEACVVAAQLLDDAQDDLQRLVATIQLSGAENRRTGQIDRSRAIIDRSLAQLTDGATPLFANGLRIYLATMLLFDARFDEALQIVEPIAAASVGGGGDVGETVAVLGPIGAVQGRIEPTVTVVRPVAASMARGRALLAAQPWLVSVIEGLLELEAGRLAEARAVFQPVYDEGVAAGDVEIVAWSSLQLARVAMAEGVDLDAAALGFREAAAAYGELVRPGFVAWALGGLAGALAAAGDLDGARHAAAAFDASPVHPVRLYEADAGRARAWLDVAAGDLEAAWHRLDAAATAAHDTAQWAIEAAALHDLVRLDLVTPEPGRRRDPRAVEVARRARALAARPEIDSALVRARLRHVEALLAPEREPAAAAAACAAVAADFATLGARGSAAEAWAGAARAHALAGDGRASARATLRARAVRGPSAAPPPPLLAGLSEPRLTRQQLSIARFAATGASRQSIADQCFVSLRTVDRHLVDVFLALGVHRREELAAALDDLAASHTPL